MSTWFNGYGWPPIENKQSEIDQFELCCALSRAYFMTKTCFLNGRKHLLFKSDCLRNSNTASIFFSKILPKSWFMDKKSENNFSPIPIPNSQWSAVCIAVPSSHPTLSHLWLLLLEFTIMVLPNRRFGAWANIYSISLPYLALFTSSN